jgi:hypothetical protein
MVTPAGLLVVLLGVLVAVRPYSVAQFEEQLDAIGSKRSLSDVEPADWKVTLTRFFRVAITLFGLLVLFTG